ncbi:MAG: TIGR02281 family clan AA aspartic protease [Pseudomonadales bacterium]
MGTELPTSTRVCLQALGALVLTVAAVLAGAATAVPAEVVALFKDRAMLRSASGERLLRVGETTPEGVTLLAADADRARVRYRDEVVELTLSRRVAGSFAEAERQRVDIAPDAFGQYRIRGAINDRFVNFLVDTGASVVAMSTRHAQSLGLDYERGQPGTVQTAQGLVNSFFVNLDRVVVGGITVPNVQAAVIEGDYPVEILLGMSFLRQVAMEERAGVLSLTQKF